jgi:hypothetical protein
VKEVDRLGNVKVTKFPLVTTDWRLTPVLLRLIETFGTVALSALWAVTLNDPAAPAVPLRFPEIERYGET